MTAWKITYMVQAVDDLHEIFNYISLSLLVPETAENQIQRIIDAIRKLDHMPLRYPLYEKEPLRSNGLRVLPVDNYLVFYLPNETLRTVVVLYILYGGRDINEQLQRKLQ